MSNMTGKTVGTLAELDKLTPGSILVSSNGGAIFYYDHEVWRMIFPREELYAGIRRLIDEGPFTVIRDGATVVTVNEYKAQGLEDFANKIETAVVEVKAAYGEHANELDFQPSLDLIDELRARAQEVRAGQHG